MRRDLQDTLRQQNSCWNPAEEGGGAVQELAVIGGGRCVCACVCVGAVFVASGHCVAIGVLFPAMLRVDQL